MIYLKNGSVIKGVVLEQVPNESIKVKTADGSIFVYQMSEVSRIALDEDEEVKKTDYKDGRHRGLDFNISAGYMLGVGDNKGSNSIPVEIGLGKQVNNNLYVGLATGAWIPKKGNPTVPVALQFRVQQTPGQKPAIPNLSVGLAYGINTNSGKYAQDLFALQLMPGLTLPMSETSAAMISAGYIHAFNLGKGGGSGGYFAVKAGFNFNKNPIKKVKEPKPKKPKKPVRSNGAIYNIELGSPAESFSFGYRFNKCFSASVGVGYMGTPDKKYTYQQIYGNNESVEEGNGNHTGLTTFLRGTYRPIKKRFSPIISCDLGLFFDSSDKAGGYGYADEGQNVGTVLYVRPSIGLSWRTSANSYLELKCGYMLTGKHAQDKLYYEEGNKWYSFKPTDLSMPTVSIGFKRNLKWLSK